MDKDIERKAEQVYFDNALEHRERRRGNLGSIPEAAAHKGAAAGLRRIADDANRNLRGPDEAVAFGRIDLETPDDAYETFYIGHNAIWDEDTQDVLVINWRLPRAAPFFTATHMDSQGLSRKRSFRCEDNTILDFEDTVFAELAARVAAIGGAEPQLDDLLLKELARKRTGEMQEIVRTIQAAQFEVVRAPFDELLVVQGGPGTGKTAVALHRVSWLLYNQAELDTGDVLVVGPNTTFVRYIRAVLPALGDRDVRHVAIGGLGAAQVRPGRAEDPEVARLKGEARMGDMLDRALQQRVRVPSDEVSIRTGLGTVKIAPEQLSRVVDSLRNRPYAAGRAALREELRARTGAAPAEVVENLLDRIWPNLTPAQFLQELLGSQNRLLEAAGEYFSAREVLTLYRQAAQRVTDETWTEADVALLDHAHARISDVPDRYRHIVVDEAQDLSPMQLAMLARRSINGSMTVLGDVAQSSGPWARDNWSDVIAALGRDGVPTQVEQLDIGYRVPRPAFELAVDALGDDVPSVRIPRVVREGPEPRMIRTSEPERAAAAVAAARSFTADGYLVGIICPDVFRPELLSGFESARVLASEAQRDGLGAAITILSPSEAKGLEFDAVVVVEPSAIAAEDRHGRRLLYIGYTRTTSQLAVVHAVRSVLGSTDGARYGETSSVSSVGVGVAAPSEVGSVTAAPSSEGPPNFATRAIAHHLIEEIRAVVRDDQIEEVLSAMQEELAGVDPPEAERRHTE